MKEQIESVIIEMGKSGFIKINNSMWKKGACTLQNNHVSIGDNIYERILSTRRAFKACVNGKFIMMIESENDFHSFIDRFGNLDK